MVRDRRMHDAAGVDLTGMPRRSVDLRLRRERKSQGSERVPTARRGNGLDA
jgi:hypothetical protein